MTLGSLKKRLFTPILPTQQMQNLIWSLRYTSGLYILTSLVIGAFIAESYSHAELSPVPVLFIKYVATCIAYSIPVGAWLFPLYVLSSVFFGTRTYIQAPHNSKTQRIIKGVVTSFVLSILISVFFMITSIAFLPLFWLINAL